MSCLYYCTVAVRKAKVLVMFIPRCSNIEAGSQFDCTEKRGEV